ncbi:MAG: nicotinate phosphoribosyltransferase [Polyangiaceae bacterium]
MDTTAFSPLGDNPITMTDSYKASHWEQYPSDVASMYSYFESRGGRYRSTVFFGLQYYLLHYMLRPITREHVVEAALFFARHGEPFNEAGWHHLVDAYGGHFPVRIRAVPEGTVLPTSNVLFDIELTTPDPSVFWVVSWLETLLVQVWYPTTVASLSHYCKEKILDALVVSADDPLAEVGQKLHDFGARGGSSQETIRIGGAAHLVNFLGSDTVEGVRCANHYYFHEMAAFSVPAAEHSTVTMWGRDREEDAYANVVQKYLIDRQLPVGVPKIAACVSDSYDIYNAVENLWCGPRLHAMVKRSGGKLVIRPDSGSPAEVDLKCLQILDRKLGTRRNTKGYKLLPSYFGLLQGDGINDETLPEILHAIVSRGYSASNIGFGIGGGLLQQVNRDTQRFAFKCAAALRGGEWIDVSKDPVTDSGKRSKKGHQALVRENGEHVTLRGPRNDDILVPVYENGRVLRTYTLDEVRANSMRPLV